MPGGSDRIMTGSATDRSLWNQQPGSLVAETMPDDPIAGYPRPFRALSAQLTDLYAEFAAQILCIPLEPE